MSRVDSEPYSLLVAVDRSADVDGVRRALEDAGIPFHSGLLAGPPARVMFYVPTSRLDSARDAIPSRGTTDGIEHEDGAPDDEPTESAHALFPWGPVQLVGGLILIHLYLVVWPGLDGLAASGGLIPGRLASEPWRLVTSLFLHADLRHTLWNGLSTLVFAVPLLTWLGSTRTALIYGGAGVGGGLAASAFSPAATIIIGSSGAVAGLFGAWVVLTFHRARHAALARRARIRTLGIALLVLPALLNPLTPGGRPISVSSHVGGLLTGMLVGAALSYGMRPLRRITGPSPDRIPEDR